MRFRPDISIFDVDHKSRQNVLSENSDYEDDKRKTALDALKTWRNEVLPDLEPGTIVTNTPTEGGRDNNQRERIYQLI